MSELVSERAVKVVALVGSLRAASINRGLADVAVANAPSGIDVSIHEGLDLLPFYNEDLDPSCNEAAPTLPASIVSLREAVALADAVLIVTPEYNGTIPAVLKNAIDWLSRPYGAGAVGGKPVGVVGAALGRYAGTWSRQDTRKAVGIAGGRVIEDVEIGIITSTLTEVGVQAPEVVEQIVTALDRLAAEVAVSA